MDTIRTAIGVLRAVQTGRALYRGAGRALGLEDERQGGPSAVAQVAMAAGLVGGGLLVGAALGVLFAPTSGKELREKIGDQLGELLGGLVFGKDEPEDPIPE